jgi:hypothetical protein
MRFTLLAVAAAPALVATATPRVTGASQHGVTTGGDLVEILDRTQGHSRLDRAIGRCSAITGTQSAI